MLVPEAEDKGDALAVGIAQAVEEIPEDGEPALESFVVLSPFEYGGHHLVGTHVPGGSAGEDVAGMPGEGDHSPSFHVLYGRPAYKFEGHSVEAGAAAELDFTELKAEDGGIFAADFLHVRAFQRIVGRIFDLPAMAVAEVVLMAVKDLARFGRGLEAVEKTFATGSGSVPAGSSEHDGQAGSKDRFKYMSHFQFFGALS